MGEKTSHWARVLAVSENGVKPIKTVVEVEADEKIEYLTKLKIDNRNTADSFKISHRLMNKDDGIKFLPKPSFYPDIFNHLMFFFSEPGSKDFNDYKNSKAYSYHVNSTTCKQFLFRTLKL